jgi:ParB-like chromosome segregation protein Spo0J
LSATTAPALPLPGSLADQLDEDSILRATDLPSDMTLRWKSEPRPDAVLLPSALPLSAIKKCEELFQPRKLDERHLHELGQVLRSKTRKFFDPLTVIAIGADAYIVDGHHRYTAYVVAKTVEPVPVVYFPGTVADAVIDAGAANHKAKLTMTSEQRSDRAWVLVTLGQFSKAEIAKGSGASSSQVAEMRRTRTKLQELGLDPADYSSWWKARQASNGSQTVRPEWTEERMDQLASQYAVKLSKAVGPRLVENPELAAAVLAKYFGRKLEEVDHHLAKYLPDPSDEEDDEDQPF